MNPKFVFQFRAECGIIDNLRVQLDADVNYDSRAHLDTEVNYNSQVHLDTVLKEVKSYGDFVFRRHLTVESITELFIKDALEHLRATMNESINLKLTTLSDQLTSGVLQSQVRKYPTVVNCAEQVFHPVQDRIVDGEWAELDKESIQCLNLVYFKICAFLSEQHQTE